MFKFAAIAAIASSAAALSMTEVEVRSAFEAFKAEHGQEFGAEEEARLDIFRSNLDFIERHNAMAADGLRTHTVGVNKFAAMSNEEYRQMLKTQGTKPSFGASDEITAGDAPASADLRTTGIVGPAKDQGQCGSCWAFSAVASMEGASAQAHDNEYTSFSEQEIVDCTLDGANNCNMGGLMQQGFAEIIHNHGGKINTEEQYPYTGKSLGVCNADDSTAFDAGIASYLNVTSGDEDALKTAASKSVVSIAIDASEIAFQLYSGGVYSNDRCKNAFDDLDHGVAIVGYDTMEDGGDYWIVRNSWGTSWGVENGYIFMARNQDNMCGVATDASVAQTA